MVDDDGDEGTSRTAALVVVVYWRVVVVKRESKSVVEAMTSGDPNGATRLRRLPEVNASAQGQH